MVKVSQTGELPDRGLSAPQLIGVDHRRNVIFSWVENVSAAPGLRWRWSRIPSPKPYREAYFDVTSIS